MRKRRNSSSKRCPRNRFENIPEAVCGGVFLASPFFVSTLVKFLHFSSFSDDWCRGALVLSMTRTLCNRSESGQSTLATDPNGDLWGRLPKAGDRFWGLSRSTIFEMVQRGEVRSCLIKKRHAQRGIRLIYLPSLREALDKLAAGSKN